MTAAEQTTPITADGVYPDVSHVDYLADPVDGGSLSSTGARRLLPPSCPARFKYELDHGSEPTESMNLGSAAHQRVLGNGPELAVIPDDVLASNGAASTKAAKDFIAAARARGAIPLSRKDFTVVDEMAAKIRAHPIASKLLGPDNGTTETTLVWTDELTGVKCRARLDLLPHPRAGRMILPDYKTCDSAERAKFARAAMNYGYHQQAAFYCDGIRALDLAGDVAFVFVAQEKYPPYLVNVVQLDVNAMKIGALLNRRAITTYAECVATNHWPSYSDGVELVSLPAWYERQFEDEGI